MVREQPVEDGISLGSSFDHIIRPPFAMANFFERPGWLEKQVLGKEHGSVSFRPTNRQTNQPAKLGHR